MRTLLFLTVLLCSITSFAQKKKATPFIKDRPLPAAAVNDFAKILTKSQKDHLEKQINAFRKGSGYDIVIITVPTVTDTRTNTLYSAKEVARLYFEKWSAGDTMSNNRLLLLKSPDEIRILTGAGVSAQLTNADLDNVIEKMRPAFNANLHFSLFKDGITAIQKTIYNAEHRKKMEQIASITNPPPAEQAASPATKKEDLTIGEAIVGFFIWFVIIYWFIARRRRKRAFSAEFAKASLYQDVGGAWLTREARIGQRSLHEDD
jgi:uncharacterized membrane protein YgcG